MKRVNRLLTGIFGRLAQTEFKNGNYNKEFIMGKNCFGFGCASGPPEAGGFKKKRRADCLALALALILTGSAGTLQAACTNPNGASVTCTGNTTNSAAIGGGNSATGDGRTITVGDGSGGAPCKPATGAQSSAFGTIPRSTSRQGPQFRAAQTATTAAISTADPTSLKPTAAIP